MWEVKHQNGCQLSLPKAIIRGRRVGVGGLGSNASPLQVQSHQADIVLYKLHERLGGREAERAGGGMEAGEGALRGTGGGVQAETCLH